MAAITAVRTSIDARTAPVELAHQVRCVLVEARPVVLVVFLMRLLAASGLLGQFSAGGIAAVAGWIPLVVAVYVFNGVTDLRADAANGSPRPIATGRLGRGAALRWCLGSACCGLALCWLASPFVFGLGCVLLAVGWAYSDGPALKNKPIGFALIIGLGAALTYAAGWVAGGATSVQSLAIMLIVAVWVGLCCASKDFSDVEGDRLAGRRTWPVTLGPGPAARLLAAVAIAFASTSLVLCFVSRVSIAPGCVLVAGSALVAFAAVSSAAGPDRATRRRPYRAFMATQYATNLALIVVGFG